MFLTSCIPYYIPHKILKYNKKSATIDRSYYSYNVKIVIFFVKDQFVNLEIIVRWSPKKPEHIERCHLYFNNRKELDFNIIGSLYYRPLI